MKIKIINTVYNFNNIIHYEIFKICLYLSRNNLTSNSLSKGFIVYMVSKVEIIV